MKAVDALKPAPSVREKIEASTREKNNMANWFKVRKFRITASICHSVANLRDISKRATALKLTCDPPSFSTAATQFGLEHEEDALSRYREKMLARGEAVTTGRCGFVLDQEKGYLGASPDGAVTLSNGTKGILEIKCPISLKDMTIKESMQDQRYPVSYVSNLEHGRLRLCAKLKRSHDYWHQAQMQLYCCRDFATFCDFVIFHVNTGSVYIERITSNDEWVTKFLPKFSEFYLSHVTPKLLKNISQESL